jgi:hypothetical protein
MPFGARARLIAVWLKIRARWRDCVGDGCRRQRMHVQAPRGGAAVLVAHDWSHLHFVRSSIRSASRGLVKKVAIEP